MSNDIPITSWEKKICKCVEQNDEIIKVLKQMTLKGNGAALSLLLANHPRVVESIETSADVPLIPLFSNMFKDLIKANAQLLEHFNEIIAKQRNSSEAGTYESSEKGDKKVTEAGTIKQVCFTQTTIDQIGYVIGDRFKSVGRYLNLSEYDLMHISSITENTLEKAVKTVNKWKNASTNPTWEEFQIKLKLHPDQILEEIKKYLGVINTDCAESGEASANVRLSPEYEKITSDLVELNAKIFDYLKQREEKIDYLSSLLAFGAHESSEKGDKNVTEAVAQIAMLHSNKKTSVYNSPSVEIKARRIEHGCFFLLKVHNVESCIYEDFKLDCINDEWHRICRRQSCQYQEKGAYSCFKKNTEQEFWIKVANFYYNDVVTFRFWFKDLNENDFYEICCVDFKGNSSYYLFCKQILLALPELISNNFNESIQKEPDAMEWITHIDAIIPEIKNDKDIISSGIKFIDTYFCKNDFFFNSQSFEDEDIHIKIVVSCFQKFLESEKGIRALFTGYNLQYHASKLNIPPNSFHLSEYKNSLTVLSSKRNLIMLCRITSLQQIITECSNCLSDVTLFYNVNKACIENTELSVLGIIILPFNERKELEDVLYFQYSEKSFRIKVLFLCKDELEDSDKFKKWWTLIEAVIVTMRKKKVEVNENVFKEIIGLTMLFMATIDQSYLPPLKCEEIKRLKDLISNDNFTQYDVINFIKEQISEGEEYSELNESHLSMHQSDERISIKPLKSS